MGRDLPKDGPRPESLRGLTKATGCQTPRPRHRRRRTRPYLLLNIPPKVRPHVRSGWLTASALVSPPSSPPRLPASLPPLSAPLLPPAAPPTSLPSPAPMGAAGG